MQKLTFTNTKGENFIIGHYKPYFLSQITGISDIPVSLQSEKGFRQDGTTPTASIIESRTIAMTVTIFGDSPEEIYQNRRNIIKFFNPKGGNISILYQNSYMGKVISGRVQQMPTITPPEEGKGGKYQKAVISIQCDKPFFEDEEEITKELALRFSLWELPLSIPETGVELGVFTNKRLIINNDGDVGTPIIIEWIGNVTNPKISNETTGEHIKVNIQLLDKEKITISTEYGNKSVIKTDAAGTKTNAFGLIDLSSDFFSLVAGENVIAYSADSGADESTLFIHYKNRFVGV